MLVYLCMLLCVWCNVCLCIFMYVHVCVHEYMDVNVYVHAGNCVCKILSYKAIHTNVNVIINRNYCNFYIATSYSNLAKFESTPNN